MTVDSGTEASDRDGRERYECVRYRVDYTDGDRESLERLRAEGQRLADGSDGRMTRDSSRHRTSGRTPLPE